ncbi:MAG: cell division protein FtsX [Desulfonatronovibrionaceae bacterium]
MRLFFRLVAEGFRDVRRTRGVQALTLTAVTLMALLAAFFLLLLFNLQLLFSGPQSSVEFQIYWEKGTEEETVRRQWAELEDISGSEVQTFTPETALRVMSEDFGQGQDFAALEGDNPLPYTAVVRVGLPEDNPGEWSREILNRLQAMPGVKEVHYNPLQMDLAQTWVRVVKTIVWPLNIALFVMLGLIVANTIKLAQSGRKEDMEILSIIGASRFFMRLPLLTVGLLQAFAGGVLALGLLKLIQLGLQEVLHFPPFWIRIQYLPWQYLLLFMGILLFVALLSGLLAGLGAGSRRRV